LLFVDIDRFKQVNDSLGHRIGDLLLKNIANLLQKNVFQTQTVARLSSDVFAVVISSTDLDAIRMKVSLLKEALAEPLIIENYRLRVSLRVGVSRYPHDAKTAEELLQNAGIAEQNAKACLLPYRCFDTELGQSRKKRLEIEADLLNALERNEFLLLHQPKIDARSYRVSGVEALIRWEHPARGLVSPLDFIPVAEETGLIVDLGEWVIREAIADQVRWEKLGYNASVAVNVSPLQFNTQKFPEIVSGILREYSCAADRLNLEITESTLGIDETLVLDILNDLCRQGIAISIDDFGTGYSNLANLQRFPIDYLKIDRSFVSDPNHSPLLLTILELGKQMQLRMVAEGVETLEQAEMLTSLQCDELQGFFFSRPLCYADLLEFFQTFETGEHRLRAA